MPPDAARQTDQREGPETSGALALGLLPRPPAALDTDQEADGEREAEPGEDSAWFMVSGIYPRREAYIVDRARGETQRQRLLGDPLPVLASGHDLSARHRPKVPSPRTSCSSPRATRACRSRGSATTSRRRACTTCSSISTSRRSTRRHGGCRSAASCAARSTLSLDDIRARPRRSLPVTLECAGNGRARLFPRPISQPWLNEAVGTAEWTGTPLAGLLAEAGVAPEAVEILFSGTDHGVEKGYEHDYARSLDDRRRDARRTCSSPTR